MMVVGWDQQPETFGRFHVQLVETGEWRWIKPESWTDMRVYQSSVQPYVLWRFSAFQWLYHDGSVTFFLNFLKEQKISIQGNQYLFSPAPKGSFVAWNTF